MKSQGLPIDFTPQNKLSHKISEEARKTIDFINQKIAAIESLPQIIDFLFEKMQIIIPCHRLAVSFFEEDGKRLTIYYVKASYEPLYLNPGYSADIDNSSLERVFASGEIRIINNLMLYLKDHPASDTTKLLIQEGINSSITIPLNVDGRPVGLLFISSRDIQSYNLESVEITKMIIERIGQAVEKTYRIQKLSEAINSYMEMLSFVSHELKSPLDSIISLGTTLAEGYFGKMDERHREYVWRMIKKAKYLREMVSEYLTLSRFENNNIGIYIQDCNFYKDIIEEIYDIIKPQANEKNIKINLHLEQDLTLQCDINLIKIVMNNLMSNAVKYGNENGTIDLKAWKDEENIYVSVKNTGPGFPPEAKSKLFRKFSRIETDELMKRKGTGVGLYTTWKIIQMHKGHIKAESKLNEWAEFSFNLPLKQAVQK
ncbi:MAG TPA: GAF domain-containing sensor histidine kinase [Spirochaetota bacterium]|jgi:signal transduction histidine kinase|nr:MAG: Non-motile and phage-resistance protein [Spirochaetes bacterium ADurb.Bin218]HOQ12691.1 GAF domain-containing sensor histidine kinase [Spirochaetota bacterium]HOV08407.1 GAF domain-containing sensor histidine kinase [Spirochaetota bacterium]HPP94437.1 GAF domain-containing sensor histidine kinase [Spirochaetota bacterium]